MSYRLRELIRLGVPDKLLHFYACPHGGKDSGPAGPDYTALAEQSAASAKSAAAAQTWANRPDQYSPWGSTTWTPNETIDPATGEKVTSWSQVQQLNPTSQAALDQQQAQALQKSQLASQMMGRVASDTAQPFNWDALPGMSGGPQMQATGTYDQQAYIPQTTQTTNAPAFSQERQDYTNQMWNQMQPQHARQEDAARTQLLNQGLTAGSEAYNRELERLHGQQAGERWNAVQAGGAEQERMNRQLLAQQQQAFGQGTTAGEFYNKAGQNQYAQELGANAQNFQMQGQMAEYQNKLRQQAMAEQAAARGMSLQELNALQNGTAVSAPNMPSYMSASGSGGTDYSGAGKSQYESALNAFNANQQQQQSAMSGLFRLGGSVIGGIYGGPGGAAAGGAAGGAIGDWFA